MDRESMKTWLEQNGFEKDRKYEAVYNKDPSNIIVTGNYINVVYDCVFFDNVNLERIGFDSNNVLCYFGPTGIIYPINEIFLLSQYASLIKDLKEF